MAKTIKAVRQNRGNCICDEHRQSVNLKYRQYDEGTCKYRYCFVARCQDCGGSLFSMGPLACYCDGAPRWVRHPGMEQPGAWDSEKDIFVPYRVAVKPSLAKRRTRR